MKQIWIGLMWTENAYYWSDYSVLTYKNWAPNEPNGKDQEPCGNMSVDWAHIPAFGQGKWLLK